MWCVLGGPFSFGLSLFENSLLDCVKFDSKSLENVLSGFPVIEDLHVTGRASSDQVDFAVWKTLRYLSLLCLKFTDQWLECLISGLPLLERFIVLYCCELTNNSVCSHSFKSLSIDVPTIFSKRLPTCSKLIWGLSYNYLRLLKAPHFDILYLLSNFNGLKKMMLSTGNEHVFVITSFVVIIIIIIFSFSKCLSAKFKWMIQLQFVVGLTFCMILFSLKIYKLPSIS